MSQPLPLVEQLKNLEHLQELDLKIDSLKKDQSSLPAGLKMLDDSLNKIKTTLESKKAQMSEIEKVQRQAKAALDLNQDRLARASVKMDAVHNSQEFQAATKEIDQLKKLNLTLEEQDKKSVNDLGAVQKEIATLTHEFEKLQSERNSKAGVVSGQENQLKSDISTLMSERSKFSIHVEQRILSQYDRIRAARGGLGIVPTVGGRCKGCNMMVPPQLYNEVQRGTTLHSCPSCHRLLFIPVVSSSSHSSENSQSSKTE